MVYYTMTTKNWFFDVILQNYFRESDFGQNGNKYLEFRSEDFKRMDGLQSEMFKGKFYYEENDGNLKHSKSLLVKTLLSDHWNQSIDIAFANELFMYNTVLPFFYDFNYSLTKLFPKFYFGELTFGDTFNGIQLLENLQEEDYRMTNSKIFLDIHHLLLMVKKLGEFHAYSYQAKKRQPELFFQMVENFMENSNILDFEKNRFVPSLECHLEELATVEKYRDKVPLIRDIIKNPRDFTEKVFSTKKEPTAVICHGDFLRNNVIFKYDSKHIPIDIKFFDLANARYCSPITDLGLVLYMHSNQSTRDQYWDQLIDTYYDALKNTFPDNDLVPTKSEILKEFKQTILQPYILVIFFLPYMIHSEKHSTPDWLSNYFAPEHEEYKFLGLAAPDDVLQKVSLNILDTSIKRVVGDVLIDIINRGFV